MPLGFTLTWDLRLWFSDQVLCLENSSLLEESMRQISKFLKVCAVLDPELESSLSEIQGRHLLIGKCAKWAAV